MKSIGTFRSIVFEVLGTVRRVTLAAIQSPLCGGGILFRSGVIVITLMTLWSFGLARDKESASVLGRVTTLFGDSVAEARVSFYELEGIFGFSKSEVLRKVVITDKGGNYSVVGLPPGQYRVEIIAPGGYTEVWRFYLHRKAQKILDIGVAMSNFAMISPMSVSGVVRGQDGKPLADATVTLTNAYNPTEFQQIRTNKNGEYKFFSAQVGDYCVQSVKPNFFPSAVTFRLENGEHQKADLLLKPAPSLTIWEPKK